MLSEVLCGTLHIGSRGNVLTLLVTGTNRNLRRIIFWRTSGHVTDRRRRERAEFASDWNHAMYCFFTFVFLFFGDVADRRRRKLADPAGDWNHAEHAAYGESVHRQLGHLRHLRCRHC